MNARCTKICMGLWVVIAGCRFDPTGATGDGGSHDTPDASGFDAAASDSAPPPDARTDAAGSTVTAIAAGKQHTCALTSQNSIRCWGFGDSGRLGYAAINSIGDDELPASAGDVVVGLDAFAVAAGGRHTCAKVGVDSIRCWGAANFGQVGYGTIDTIGDDETPASVGNVDVGGPAQFVATGGSHTCALLTTAEVVCWGWGLYGQLGYGSTVSIGDYESPASAGVVDVGGTVSSLAAGDWFTCALMSGGAVRCWGRASYGELGYGNGLDIGDDEAPAVAGDVDVGGTVVQIAAGGNHVCVLLSGGRVRCWGRGDSGQLGYGNTDNIGDDELPVVAGDVEVGGTVVQLAAGGEHTCALLDGGAVRCWGRATYGQLGYANTNNIGDDELPAVAGDVVLGRPAVAISAGGDHTCAILNNGTVMCWGNGADGQLGYANTEDIGDDETPIVAGAVQVF